MCSVFRSIALDDAGFAQCLERLCCDYRIVCEPRHIRCNRWKGGILDGWRQCPIGYFHRLIGYFRLTRRRTNLQMPYGVSSGEFTVYQPACTHA